MEGKPYFSCDQLVSARGFGIVVPDELHGEIHQCSFDSMGEFWITKR